MESTNSIPLNLFSVPMNAISKPPESSKPILCPGYEICPCFIEMIRKQSFSGEGNPYLHLREFDQTCSCLHIVGMSDETIRWKLFLFSLTGTAKSLYYLTVDRVKGDWETLCSEFCQKFFPTFRVISLRAEVLTFRQLENLLVHPCYWAKPCYSRPNTS